MRFSLGWNLRLFGTKIISWNIFSKPLAFFTGCLIFEALATMFNLNHIQTLKLHGKSLPIQFQRRSPLYSFKTGIPFIFMLNYWWFIGQKWLKIYFYVYLSDSPLNLAQNCRINELPLIWYQWNAFFNGCQ
jgi:hypothetical protein